MIVKRKKVQKKENEKGKAQILFPINAGVQIQLHSLDDYLVVNVEFITSSGFGFDCGCVSNFDSISHILCIFFYRCRLFLLVGAFLPEVHYLFLFRFLLRRWNRPSDDDRKC